MYKLKYSEESQNGSTFPLLHIIKLFYSCIHIAVVFLITLFWSCVTFTFPELLKNWTAVHGANTLQSEGGNYEPFLQWLMNMEEKNHFMIDFTTFIGA